MLPSTLIGLWTSVILFMAPALAQQPDAFSFLPPQPVSEYVPVSDNGPDHGFCAKWDPEYGYRGKACCERVPAFRRSSQAKCSPQRIKWTFCDEMTPEQREYLELARSGKLGRWWEQKTNFQRSRAYCSVSHGFLVDGRPLVATAENRLLIRNPARCTSFGTDGLVGTLEWLGREVNREYSDPAYSGVRINVGDLSAPRGGCISGRRGRRGHASHTTGQDADIGFLYPAAGTREINAFAYTFDAKANWWLMKRLFANPFACVKAVFVDQRLIRKLAKVARGDPEWQRIGRYIRHVRGHRHHFHIRVGDSPGLPGCPQHRDDPGFDLEPSDEEDWESEGGSAQPLMEANHSVGNWSAPRGLSDLFNFSSSAPARSPSNSAPSSDRRSRVE